MNKTDFSHAVEVSYHKYFPDSLISLSFSRLVAGSFWIRPYLAASEKETANQNIDNDVFHVLFSVEGIHDNLNDEIVVEVHHKTFTTTPTNTFCVYGHEVFPMRKIKGNPEKVLKTLDKYFAGMRTALLEAVKTGRIHTNHIEIVNKKLNPS